MATPTPTTSPPVTLPTQLSTTTPIATKTTTPSNIPAVNPVVMTDNKAQNVVNQAQDFANTKTNEVTTRQQNKLATGTPGVLPNDPNIIQSGAGLGMLAGKWKATDTSGTSGTGTAKAGTDTGTAGTGTAGTGTDTGTGNTEADQLKAVQDQRDLLTSQIQTNLLNLQNSTFQLTPAEQADINATQSQFDALIRQQQQTNLAYTAGTRNLEASTGRNRYAPDLAMSKINDSVSTGLQKVADLESKAAQAISQLQMQFEDKWNTNQNNKWNQIKDLYDVANNALNQKTQTIKDMNTAVTTEMDNLKNQATYSFDTLDKFAAAGIEPPASELTKFDAALGGTGVAKQYYDAAKTKAEESAQIAQTGNIYKVLSTVPDGTPVTFGDVTYTGTKNGSNTVMKEWDKKTNTLTTIVVDKDGVPISSHQTNVSGSTTSSKSSSTSYSYTKAQQLTIEAYLGKDWKTTSTRAQQLEALHPSANTDNVPKLQANQIEANLKSQQGDDNFVSPEDYAAAKADWIKAGGGAATAAGFDDAMGYLRNPNNKNYKLG